MRIKSLQLHGFKSFVDRTVFTFNDGITAVVGPNGCGKSNVVDGIRWVMGEQSPRRLRGKGMEDVIFAGAENRPPIGMAEIQLTFDNSDGRAPAAFSAYQEIQITRRLYRSGESEYMLNGAPCRLRDIQDFFRDTGIGVKGYTIVEQGRIAEIVSARPEDRRVLIEEAAGISKYKARRREAESKLVSTEQNLTRVHDVLGEIRRQISSLERQARRAARYKRLHETRRVLELSLAADERRELLQAVDHAQGQLTSFRDRVTGLETKVSERELAGEEKRIALAEAEKAVAQAAEKLYALRSDIKGFEGQIELSQRERETLEESNIGRREELTQLAEQRRVAERDAGDAESQLQRMEDSLAGEAEEIRAAEEEARNASETQRASERERDAANDALVGVLTSMARAEDRLSVLDQQQVETDQRLRAADRELETQQTAAGEAGDEHLELEERLRNLLADRDRFQEQLIRAMNAHEQAVGAAQASAEELQQARERCEARRARYESLREVVETRGDVSHGTRHLLERGEGAAQQYGLRGLLRDQFEVDRDAERAVEVVLADRAGAIVTDDVRGAVDALARLRQDSAGRGMFIVEPGAGARAAGIVPLGERLLERVQPKPGFEGIARALFGEVYLVSSLAEVLEAYSANSLPATFVTGSGDMISPDGFIQGGSDTSSTGSLTRLREVTELETELAGLDRNVEQCQVAAREAETRRIRATEELDNLRNRHHTAALAVANDEKDLERSNERVKTLDLAREQGNEARSGLLEHNVSLVSEGERLRVEIEEFRSARSAAQSELDRISLQITAATREVTRLESRTAELRVTHQGRVESRDRFNETANRAATTLRDTAAWIERREQEISSANQRRETLGEEVVEAERCLAEKLDEEEGARRESERLRTRYDEQAQVARDLEEQLRDCRSQLSAHRDEMTGADLAVRESELRLRHQDDAIREKWSVDLATWTPPSLDELSGEEEAARDPEPDAVAAEATEVVEAAEDPESDTAESTDSADELKEHRRNAELCLLPREDREQQLEEVRNSVQSLGDVNMGAIEEHEELAERFRFLSEQKADLETTIQSLREAISRINRTSRKRFRETFELVSQRFSENFPRLFDGGKASLQLTESEDVLEAGIEIMAMPPGKRLQSVSLLSGGEKTMTALALLVAVFQVRPSPFFLLDEVDAALDDANVGRFNQLLYEMATQSQFLVITHNKRTIEVADVLYGVTMEQKGVSKLVAVELR